MHKPTRLRDIVLASVALFAGCYSSGNVLETRDARQPEHDAGSALDASIDASVPTEPASCRRVELGFDFCGSCDDAPRGWYWDGSRCVDGGPSQCPCVGTDCTSLQTYGTRDACESAHASCNANLCRATGGSWFEVAGCGFRCGAEVQPRPNIRCAGGPACMCGPGQNFQPGIGCVDDPECTVGDLCLATGGQPTGCGANSACGLQTDDCAVTWPEDARSCTCGPRTRFDPTLGCVLDESCGTASEQTLCGFTGGQWVGGYCGHARCGVPSPLACASGGCNCGEYEIFDPVRGCVWSSECDPRPSGASCDERTRCAAGLACCGGVCVSSCMNTANPCGSGTCDAVTGCRVDATFECGGARCDRRTQYCSVEIPGPGGPIQYECLPYPTECGATPGCECIDRDGCEPSCVEESGAITLTCGFA